MKITTGLIAIVIMAFIILCLVIGALMWLGKDAASYVALVGSLLGSAISAIVLLYGMHQQNTVIAAQGSDITTVKTNTNGTLSALRAENAAQAAQLQVALAKLAPSDAQTVLDSTLTRAQVSQAVAVATSPALNVPATLAAQAAAPADVPVALPTPAPVFVGASDTVAPDPTYVTPSGAVAPSVPVAGGDGVTSV
jgi:uncharacterized SAM-binding protein YcdF (DUF218 family)